jgi:hypothetical protein
MIHFVGMETKENRNRLTGVVWWWHVYPPPPLFHIFPFGFFSPSASRMEREQLDHL